MKATILDERVKVYRDVNSLAMPTRVLDVGTEVELGQVEERGGNEWVEVTLPDYENGFISGDTKIYEIQKVTLNQNRVNVYRGASVESGVLDQFVEGAEFWLTDLITKKGDTWLKIRDLEGNVGFINGDTKLNVQEATADDMKGDLRSWGFGLIGIGVISIVLSGFLDPAWGVLLIFMGGLTLLIQQRGMFIAIGITLWMAGLMNVSVGEFGGWTIFGFLQFYWGAQEIRKFWLYAPND